MVSMRHIILALLCAVAGPVLAQAMPTDVDLRAAYCARVASQQLTDMQRMMGAEPESSPAYAFVQKTLKEQEGVVNRLQSYLLPKLSSLKPDPVMLAVNRADVDLQEAKEAAGACARRCAPYLEGGRPNSRWSACADECLAGPLHSRLKGCRTPDWLPF